MKFLANKFLNPKILTIDFLVTISWKISKILNDKAVLTQYNIVKIASALRNKQVYSNDRIFQLK